MGEDQSTDRPAVNEARDPEELQAEIEETRRELGDTVAALSAKTDVKAQAKAKLDDAKTTVTDKREEFVGKAKEISPDSALAAASTGSKKIRRNPLPVAIAGAFAGGFLIGRITARGQS